MALELPEAVESHLARDRSDAGIGACLGFLVQELDIDRISLHAIDESRKSFRVVAGGGASILAPGTQLPVDASTQVAVPTRGGIFRRRCFDEGSFDRPLDRLVHDMGYRSGCSVPLYMGSRTIGTVCVSSRSQRLETDPLLDALDGVSAHLALACYGAGQVVKDDVLLYYDDQVTAEGISRVVERSIAADVRICGTVSDAVQPYAGARTPRSTIIICDSLFMGERVDAFLPLLRSAGVSGPALVIASHDSPLARQLAYRSGAAGYVALSDGSARIEEAVRDVVAGRVSRFAPRDGAVGDAVGDGAVGDGADVVSLTPQETNVLRHLECGLRFKQIALQMGISESTVKGYARNLFAKLDCHSRSEAVYEARRQGLLDFLSAG